MFGGAPWLNETRGADQLKSGMGLSRDSMEVHMISTEQRIRWTRIRMEKEPSTQELRVILHIHKESLIGIAFGSLEEVEAGTFYSECWKRGLGWSRDSMLMHADWAGHRMPDEQ